MSSKELLLEQAKRWVRDRSNASRPLPISTDTEAMNREIANLKKQEDRYTKAYGEGVFSLEKLRELTITLKDKITSLELKIMEVQQESQASNDLPVLEPHEVELFAHAARERLHNLSFEQKRGIVMNVVDLIVSQPNELQVRGRIPLTATNPSAYNLFLCIDGQLEEITNNHVEFKTSDRYRRSAQRREINAV